MQGQIDLVTPAGVVEGWCWDELAPDDTIDVTIFIDGIASGNALAGLFREDLRQAGIGDGFHFFSVVLTNVSAPQKRTQTFILMRTSTLEQVGEPLTIYNKMALSFDGRLAELETRNRLLETRLNELAEQGKQASAPAELFSVVGAFFIKLAQEMAEGGPLSLDQRVDNVIQAAIKAHPVFALETPEHPVMTILIQAGAPLSQLYACLTALRRAGADRMASIVVIDPGLFDDVALISSIVRGLRYVRALSDVTSEWIEAELSDSSDLVVALSGRAIVAETWLTDLATSFAFNATAGAIGGCFVDASQRIRHGGFHLVEGALLDQQAIPSADIGIDLTVAHPAHALSHHAIAIRRRALREVGGLDATFADDLGAAVIDLCCKLRREGWSVIVQPFATLTLQPNYIAEPWLTSSLIAPSPIGDLLRRRWLEADAAHPPLYRGHAAVVATIGNDPEDLCSPPADLPEPVDALSLVRQLREAFYAVTYFGPTSVPFDQVRDLQRAGATVTLSDVIGQALTLSPVDLVVAAEHSVALERRPANSRLAVGGEALSRLLDTTLRAAE